VICLVCFWRALQLAAVIIAAAMICGVGIPWLRMAFAIANAGT
jgi:hypothetical protein